MKLNSSQTAQTTPLFFNCTEKPIPIPTQDYLSGIQGVQPLAVAEAPQLAPPPTGATGVGPVGMSSMRSMQRRPDALYKDSVSAAGARESGQGGQSGQGGEVNNNSVMYEEQQNQYHAGVYTGQYSDYQHQYDYRQGYNQPDYQQYHANNQENYANYQEYYSNYHEYYANNEAYYAEQHAREQQRDQNPETNQYQHQENVTYHSQHEQPGYLTHEIQNTQHQPNSVVQNSGASFPESNQENTHTGDREDGKLLSDSENVPQSIPSSECDNALSKINDDFWGMGISVHTDDALS